MIKILFLASNPVDPNSGLMKAIDVLQLPEELKAIEAELRNTPMGFLYAVEHVWAVRVDELHHHLLRHRPDIVHFSGHGDPQRGIILKDENDEGKSVTPHALGRLFAAVAGDIDIRCLVLNACYLGPQADEIVKSIPCVLGMAGEIKDDSAIKFATAFYGAVGFGKSVQEAFDLGRARLAEEGATDEDLPTLRNRPDIEPRKLFFLEITPKKKKKLHGKYTIKGELGSRLTSRVELAFDEMLQRHVAIKTLTLTDPTAAEKFVKDAHDFAKISKHPNIVSVYGAWLDKDPHYIRQYVDGPSLREELRREDSKPLRTDFVQQALDAIGQAMGFAQEQGVWDLGVTSKSVYFEQIKARSSLRRDSSYNIIVCPENADSESRRDNPLGRFLASVLIYLPPESLKQHGLHTVDPDKANQYTLGVLGYEMLLGVKRFEERQSLVSQWAAWQSSGSREPFPPWPDLGTEGCPRFLGAAIRRMVDPDPYARFETLDDAVNEIAHRNLDVEIARDSFQRILKDAQSEFDFFHSFYLLFLDKCPGSARVFELHDFPSRDDLSRWDTKGPIAKWPKQFKMLKEAIVLLFAFNMLRETQGHTILTRIAGESYHGGVSRLFYDSFLDALVETVDKFNPGNDNNELKNAWRNALQPGITYMKHFPAGP